MLAYVYTMPLNNTINKIIGGYWYGKRKSGTLLRKKTTRRTISLGKGRRGVGGRRKRTRRK